MDLVYQYNIKFPDCADLNFARLFEERRRDSVFAGVLFDGQDYYAFRDHLGIAPLFYCKDGSQYYFATNTDELLNRVRPQNIDPRALRVYLGLGTPRLMSLWPEIKIVPPGAVIKLNPNQGEQKLYQYQIKPRLISWTRKFEDLVDEFEVLFIEALKRQVQSPAVGLYLSGGIDSGLIGVYLKKMGVRVNSYSSATGGRSSSELPYLQESLKLVRPAISQIDYLTDNYSELAQAVPKLYRLPHGHPTSLAIGSLWLNTDIGKEQQIFLGQNCDVIAGAMDNHHFFTFGGQYFSRALRQRLHPQPEPLIKDYLATESHGLVDFPLINFNLEHYRELSAWQLLALAGMYLGRTPVDGETMTQPAIGGGLTIGNPYYDLDLIEFCLGLRLNHKLRWFKNRKIVSVDKRIVRELALRNSYSPALVNRKKGFTVAQGKNSSEPSGRAHFFSSLPTTIGGIECTTGHQRYAARILRRYLDLHDLSSLL